MRNTPEKTLIRSLDALMRRAPIRLRTTSVYHWRGKKFVVKKPTRIAVFASGDMSGNEPINTAAPIAFYSSEFGVR
jgi:hypothetical protein